MYEDMKRLEDIQDALYQVTKTDRNGKFYTLHDKIRYAESKCSRRHGKE